MWVFIHVIEEQDKGARKVNFDLNDIYINFLIENIHEPVIDKKCLGLCEYT